MQVDAVLPSQEQSLSNSSLAANPDGDPMQAAFISFAARFAFWKATAEAYSLAGAARSNFSEEMVCPPAAASPSHHYLL